MTSNMEQPIDADDDSVQYIDVLGDAIDSVITPELKNKYCIILGDRVLASYETLDEATAAKETEFNRFYTVLYIPK